MFVDVALELSVSGYGFLSCIASTNNGQCRRMRSQRKSETETSLCPWTTHNTCTHTHLSFDAYYALSCTNCANLALTANAILSTFTATSYNDSTKLETCRCTGYISPSQHQDALPLARFTTGNEVFSWKSITVRLLSKFFIFALPAALQIQTVFHFFQGDSFRIRNFDLNRHDTFHYEMCEFIRFRFRTPRFIENAQRSQTFAQSMNMVTLPLKFGFARALLSQIPCES